MANTAVRLAHKRRQEAIDQMSKGKEPGTDDLNNEGPQETDDGQDVPPPSDVGEQDAPQQGEQDDNQFERLQGKARKLESDNARILRELEEARQEIEKLKSPPTPQKTQKELDADFEAQLREEIGEDSWDYMDDATKKAVIAIAKRSSKTAVPDVDTKVQDALKQREEQERSREFVHEMDGLLKERGTSFIQLMNNERFETWVQSQRSRLAVFEDAMRYRDSDAVNDLKKLVDEFYSNGTEKKSNNSTPNVKASSKSRAPKSKEITYDQYLQALKDKRHPSRRAAAREIIAAFNKQQEQ